jgi:hypothetical protein
MTEIWNTQDRQDALETHDLVKDINDLQKDAQVETKIPEDL